MTWAINYRSDNYTWVSGVAVVSSRSFSTYLLYVLRVIVSTDHTHMDTNTLGRTPLDEGSARRRDLCLTTHNIHKRQTSVPLEMFEPAIPETERPQSYALHRAVA